MPTLEELTAEYNKSIQSKDYQIPKKKDIVDLNMGYKQSESEGSVPYSPKDQYGVLDEELENRRSRNQDAWDKTGIFAARLAGKAVTKTAEGAGFVGGLVGIDNNRKAYKDPNVGWDFASWIAGAADNGLAVAAMDMEKDLEDVTPLYNSIEDREANKASLFNNLSDGDFWAGDAADAGAFLVSAYLTGAATAEAKIGENLALRLAKSGLTKGAKLAKIAARTNLATATTLNTASEAMFEAKDVRDAVREQKANEEYGVSFDELNPEQQLAINKVAGQAAAGTFALNAAALIVPNFFEMGNLMKKAGRLNTGVTGLTNKGLNTVEAGASSKLFGMETAGVPYLGKAVKGFSEFGNSLSGKIIKSAAIGVAREGFYEENVQLAISNMFTNNPNSSLFDVGTIAQGMVDNFGTDEGQKSMLLGSMIGGLANTRSGVIDYNRNKKKQRQAMLASASANMNLYQANNIFEMEEYTENDAEGKPVTKKRFKLDEDGKPVVDQDKLEALVANKTSIEYLDDIATLNEESGNDVLANLAKDQAVANWVKNHYSTGTEDLMDSKVSFLENLSDKDYLELGFDPSKKNEFVVDLKNKISQFKKLASDIDSSLITKDSSKEGAASFLERKNELYNIGATLSSLRSEKNRITIEKMKLEASPELAALNAQRLAYIDLKLEELTEAESKFTEEFKKISDPVKGEKYFKDGYKKSVLKKVDTYNPETVTLEGFNDYEKSKLFKEKLNLKASNIDNEFFEKGIEHKLTVENADPTDIVNDLTEEEATISTKTAQILQDTLTAKQEKVDELTQTINELYNGVEPSTTDPEVVNTANELLQNGTYEDYINQENARIADGLEKLAALKVSDQVDVTGSTIKDKLLESFTNSVKTSLFNFNASEEYDNVAELEKQEKSLTNMIKVLTEKNDPEYDNNIAEYKDLLAQIKEAIVIAKERAADKSLQQERIINDNILTNINQFGLNLDGSILNQDLYDFYKDILGDAIDKIIADIKDLTPWGKMGYITNKLIDLKRSMSAVQLKQLEKIKSDLADKVIATVKDKSTKKSGTFDLVKKEYANNPKYIFSEVLHFLMRTTLAEGNLVMEFKKDYSVANLIRNMATKPFEPAMDIDSLNEIVSLHQQILGIENTLSFVAAEQNIITEIVSENQLNKDNITPSNQQLLAIRDLIRFFTTKKSNDGYSNLAYLKGYAGTGKTNIVIKWFTKLAPGLKVDEIYATGHDASSSETINSSIKSNKQRSIEELIVGLKSNLPGIKLIIIDEINALHQDKIKEIIDLINLYNTNNNTSLKIIGLGDPNQITTSQNAIFTPLDSISNTNVKLTLITPLTIRYRSNVQAVVDAQDIFLGKVSNVIQNGIYLTANSDRTLGADGGLSPNGIEDSIKQRDLADGKTRAIITHPSNVAAWNAKKLGVEVLTYIEAQGRTIDEVFVDIPQTAFSDDFMYNKAMYTAVSRATNFIYIQGVKTQTVTDNNVQKTTEKNVKELADAKVDFTQNRVDELAQLDPDIKLPVTPVAPTPPTPPGPNNTTNPPTQPNNPPPPPPPGNNNPPVDEDEEEIIEEEEEEIIEPEEPIEPEEESAEDAIPNAGAFKLNYPTRESIVGREDAAPVQSGERVIYTPIKNRQGNVSIGVYVTRPEGFLEIGVLSQQELDNPPADKVDLFKILKDSIKPGLPVTSFVLNASTGFSEVGTSGLVGPIAIGTVDKVSKLRYIYSKLYSDYKAFKMSDIIKTFKDGFFSGTNEGKNFDNKNFSIRVFKAAEIKSLNTDYVLKEGFPYLVIENPVQGNATKASTQFIQLERRKLNKNDHNFFMDPIYNFITKYNAFKDSIGLPVNQVADILSSTDAYLQSKGIVLTNEQKDLRTKIDELLHEPLTARDNAVTKGKKVKNSVSPVMENGKELTGKVISIDNDIATVKFGNNEAIEVEVSSLKPVVNRRPGPAQAAFDEIAKGNRTSNGIVIRVAVKSKTKKLTRGKSLLPKIDVSDPLNPATTAMSVEDLNNIFTTDSEGNVSDLKVPVPMDASYGGYDFNYGKTQKTSNSKADELLFMDKLIEVKPTSASVTISNIVKTAPTASKNAGTARPRPGKISFLLKSVNKALGNAKDTSSILKYLKSIDKTLTAEEVKFVNQAELLKISEGKEVWGQFHNGIIYLLEDDFGKTYENAARHELFHRIFNMMLTYEQQETVIKRAIKEYGLPESSTIDTVEEAIAEHYQEWRNGKKVPSFFNILFNKIRKFLGMSVNLFKDMDTFFANIEGGLFTEIVGFDDLTRNYADIKEDFDTASNFKSAQVYIVNEIAGLQNQNNTLFTPDPVTGISFFDQGFLPLSTNEMFNIVYDNIQMDHKDLVDLAKVVALSEEQKRELEVLTIINDNKIFKKLVADMFENLKVSDINDTTDSKEILDSDWTDSIKDAEQTNHETKLSTKVKQVLSTIITKVNEKNQQVNPRFAFLACLEALSNVTTNTKEELLKEIRERFKALNYRNPDIKAIETALNRLVDLAYTENNIQNIDLPKDYTFLSENTFTSGNGKFIHRGKKTTYDFFSSIQVVTGLTSEEISALYIVNDASNTFTELYAQIASLYKQNMYYGEYNGASKDAEHVFKNVVIDAQTSNFNNNIRNSFIKVMSSGALIEELPAAKWIKNNIAKVLILDKSRVEGDFKAKIDLMQKIYYEVFNENLNIDIKDKKYDISKVTKNITELVKYYEDHNTEKDFEKLLAKNNSGIFNALSKLLLSTTTRDRPASYRRGDGKIAYLFSLSSPAINTIQWFVDGFKKPAFLSNAFYSKNSFVSGKNVIHNYINFDSVKAEYSTRNVRYSDETEKDWFVRNFKFFFLAKNTADSDGRYIQQFITPSNKPNIVSAEINFLNWEEVNGVIIDILDQQASRNFTGVKVNNSLNVFEKLSPRKENQTNEAYAKQIIEVIKGKGQGLQTALDFENNVDLKRLSTAAKNHAISKELEKDATPEEAKAKMDEDRANLAAMYYANFYVNSHQLNQLVAGDQAFYKDAFDVIKRMSIAFGTGYSGLVSSFGLNKTYKSLVLQDIEEILGDDFLEFQKIWGKKFELTDAQGYMTPKRAANIRKGFGNAFKLGSVLKPVHFEIDEDGIPRAVKYSCIELTDELCETFPKLKQLRQVLEDNEIDEAVFQSAVKVGKPSNIMKANADGSIGTLVNGKYQIDTDSVLTLQNSNYRIQENPEKSVKDKEAANPAQLTYFANFSNRNFDQTNRLFKAQEALMDLGSRKLLQKLGIKERINEETRRFDQKTQRDNLRKISAANQAESTDQRQIEFLNNSKLGINTPFLVKKIITDLASAFTKATVAIRLPGAGCVLQSAYGTTSEYVDENGNTIVSKLKWRITEGKYKGHAEVILPDFWKDRFKEGDSIMFDTMLGFRIPSTELHSGIPLKVVGFYPSKNNANVIIAPAEIVFFHGSDYDVDKLYVVRREAYKTDVNGLKGNSIYKKGTIVPVTQDFLDSINAEFTSTIEEITKAKKIKDNLKVRDLVSYLDTLTALKETHYKNVIVDSFLNIITDEKNEDLMMSPITMERFKGMGIEGEEESAFDLIARLNGFKEEKPKYSDFELLDTYNEAVKKWIKNRDKVIFPTRDLYDVEDQMLMHKDNFSGTALTGAFANMAKAIAYFFQSVTEGKFPTLNNNYHIEINGYNYTGLEYFEQADEVAVNYGSDGQIVKSQPTITETIDSLINAAIDSVKEQILSIIGFTNNTGGPAVSLISMGVPLKTVVLIMRQPVINSLNREFTFDNGRAAAKKEILDALTVLNKTPLLADDLKQIDADVEEAQIDDEYLESAFTKSISEMTAPELIKQLAVLKNIVGKANTISETISTGSTAYKVLKSNPVTFPGMQDMLEAFDKMWNSVTNKAAEGFIFTNVNPIILPHINKAFKLLQTLKSNVENLIFMHSKVLQRFSSAMLTTQVENAEGVSRDVNDFTTYGNKNERKDKLRENIIHYLMTGLSYVTPEGYAMTNSTLDEPMHIDYKGKERFGTDAFNIKFREDVIALKKANPKNEFLSNISFNEYGKLIFTAARNMKQEDLVNFQRDFNSLKENGNFTPLQYNFVKYAIINQGLSFGVNNYSMILPSEIYEPMMGAFNDYFEELTGDPIKFSTLLDRIELNFKLQYALNTGKDTVLSLKKDQYKENSVTGGIVVSNEDGSPGPLFVRTKSDSLYVLTSSPLSTSLEYAYAANINDYPSYQFDTNILKGTYSLMQAFNSSIPTVKVPNNSKLDFTSKKKFEVGQKVRLVNYSDPTRLQSVEVEITEAEWGKNGKYEYTSKNPTFVSSILPDIDIVNSKTYKQLISEGMMHDEAFQKIKNNC